MSLHFVTRFVKTLYPILSAKKNTPIKTWVITLPLIFQ